MRTTRVPAPPEPGADYVSAFAVGPAPLVEPDALALTVFAGAPAPVRLVLRLGWRYGLGLRLDGPSRTLGWRADGGAEPGTVALVAEGPALAAVNRVRQVGADLVWTTTTTYRSRLGGVAWSVAAPVHHMTMPWLLARAARRLTQ